MILRAIAEYQMFTDAESPGEIMAETLQQATQAGYIKAGLVTGVHQSLSFGELHLVQFTVDLPYAHWDGMAVEAAHEEVTQLLNEIVGDSDVDVRWLAAYPG